jgi:hypothetical protein
MCQNYRLASSRRLHTYMLSDEESTVVSVYKRSQWLLRLQDCYYYNSIVGLNVILLAVLPQGALSSPLASDILVRRGRPIPLLVRLPQDLIPTRDRRRVRHIRCDGRCVGHGHSDRRSGRSAVV